MPASPALLFTIGYEGRTLPAYLAALREAQISLLCDVRRNPLSRKPGFSRRALAKACLEHGMRYEHLPELGIASSDRKNIRTPEDRQKLFARYSRETLVRESGALEKIRNWIEVEKQRVALTCFEREPCECHRHCIADFLAAENVSLSPIHL